MNIYPAIKLHMGSQDEGWTYYSIKMKMKDVGKEIGFADDLEESKSLNSIMQRARGQRAKTDIVEFLAKRKDRFFSSIVVAARGGSPTFAEVELEKDGLGFVENMEGHFGLLRFDGGQNYYALDGQHRVTAIQTLLNDPDQRDRLGITIPEGFGQEEISVIIMTTTGSEEEWKKKYRRLFSALNRYAKPVDQDTIIAMDEDDIYCILTRRIVAEYPFFQWSGNALSNEKLQCKGKNIKEGAPHFTSLQTLKSINLKLLKSPENEALGMYEKSFTNNRPTDEDKIDSWFDELVGIWDALFEAIPELNKDPSFMRTNNADEDEAAENGHENNALFRPMIQEGVVAEVARMLLNRANTNTPAGMVNALKNLALIDWNMFHAPWRHLVIIKNDQDKWIMASEERVKRVSCAQETILWLVGHLQWEEDELEEHKSTYMSYLKCSEDEQKELWDSLLKLHKKING